jgi:hypothetical protein
MSYKTPPKHLYVEYMYGFLFHYTDQPLFPTTPSYTLVKVIKETEKTWEAIYKNIDDEKATFVFDGTIKLKKHAS